MGTKKTLNTSLDHQVERYPGGLSVGISTKAGS